MTPNPPARNPLIIVIITIAMITGLVVMWSLGIFKSLGPKLSLVVVAGDLLSLALLWVLWANGKLGPK